MRTTRPGSSARASSALTAASINYGAGQTISNAVTARVGENGRICIFTYSDTDVIVDVTGAFPRGSQFAASAPGRILETRDGLSTIDGQFNGIGARAAGSVTELTVAGPAGTSETADAVVLNVAVTRSE